MVGHRVFALSTLFLLSSFLTPARSSTLKPFTVAEEIGLAHFQSWYTTAAEPIVVSPNGQYVAIRVERGLLRSNLVEDELRIYDMGALRRFVAEPGKRRAPTSIVDLHEATYKEGPIISDMRWLADSSGLAFLLRTKEGRNELALVGLKDVRLRVLSLRGQAVTAFGVSDSSHYVYTVFSPGTDVTELEGHRWTAVDGTGRPLQDLLLSERDLSAHAQFGGGGGSWLRSVLWAAVGRKPHLVVSLESHKAFVLYPRTAWLAISPDGGELCTELPVINVPRNWIHTFPPRYPNSPYSYRMHVGPQNLQATMNWGLATEYTMINLGNGRSAPVNAAPTGFVNEWVAGGGPSWSYNGDAILLPDAYPQPNSANSSAERPCAAIYYLSSDRMQCLQDLKPYILKNGAPGAGSFYIDRLRFAHQSADKVVMRIMNLGQRGAESYSTRIFVRRADSKWHVAKVGEEQRSKDQKLKIYVKQGVNVPPVIAAQDRRATAARIVWDPNPQLANIELGEASVYQWNGTSGHRWTGGLYKPFEYLAGRRYPLVIQTHGFARNEFRPSGVFPTAFAARALAASGMFVLQVQPCPIIGTAEGSCNVDSYGAAVRQLASEGLIDPHKVGIIGFSRTVYHVLAALTAGRLQFAAASITDGIDYGYWQFLVWVDLAQNFDLPGMVAEMGAKPVGDGLQLWLQRSPEFNMQKVRAPLLVVALGRVSLLDMWEPYAMLRYLRRPVDLLLLNSDEHVLTEPAIRMASQGGSVDWFRFWLEGYEDPSPSKVGQYRRWEKLCDMQKAQNPRSLTFCVPTERTDPRLARTTQAQDR